MILGEGKTECARTKKEREREREREKKKKKSKTWRTQVREIT